ncbi:MAG: ComF family protein [Solirubrobacterales bacterium]
MLCSRCRSAFGRLPAGTIAPRATLDVGFAAFPYEGVARELVHALKFRGAVAVSREMAALMVERVPTGMLTDVVLVPVPAHPANRRSRGYSQTALLARELAAICELPVLDCLVRDSARPPQSTLSRAERLRLPKWSIRAEVPASYRQNPFALAGFPTKVVLLDDVTTTGVTLEVCASAIRERYPAERLSEERTKEWREGDGRAAIGVLAFAGTSAHPGPRERLPTGHAFTEG